MPSLSFQVYYLHLMALQLLVLAFKAEMKQEIRKLQKSKSKHPIKNWQ